MVRRVSINRLSCFAVAGLLCSGAAMAQEGVPARPAPPPVPEKQKSVSVERGGVFATREGLRLKLTTDIGNVRCYTTHDLPYGTLAYKVRVEADPRQPDAQKLVEQFTVTGRLTPEGVMITGTVPWRRYRGRLNVTYEVRMPRKYSVDIHTLAGNIYVQDTDGQVTLVSSGGNLSVGRIGGAARLDTQGGHIGVLEVGGSLHAVTAGGHVNIGDVHGDATIRTLGGHINVASVRGNSTLETEGGNISLQHAGGGVTVTTAGGRIDVGEAVGAIRARTAGGGIRVVKLAGPTQLETSSGSIYLTRVQGAVRAMTAEGGITAWLAPDGKLQGFSQLESASGDILVFLPRGLALTIEATVEGEHHRIEAESGLPLKVVYPVLGARPRIIRAEAALNGGGEVLRLKALAGDIKLKFSDAMQEYYEQLYQSQMKTFEYGRESGRQMLEQQLRMQKTQQQAQEEMWRAQAEEQKQKEERLREADRVQEEPRSRVEEWKLLLEEKISGRISLDAQLMSRKLVHMVRPEYPAAARENKIEGTVWLHILVDKEGKVQEVNRISGHAVLAEAAEAAVRQWRYAPTYVGQKPVAVATAVRLMFRLN